MSSVLKKADKLNLSLSLMWITHTTIKVEKEKIYKISLNNNVSKTIGTYVS